MKKLFVVMIFLAIGFALPALAMEKAKTNNANSLALAALDKGDIAALEQSIQRDDFAVDYRYPHLNNRTLLGEVCYRKCTDTTCQALWTILRYLIKKEHSGSFTMMDNNQWSPLHLAVFNHDPRLLRTILEFQELLDIDCNIHKNVANQWTPLNLAVSERRREHVRALLAKPSANPNIPNHAFRRYPLHSAIRPHSATDDLDTARDLVEAGAEVDCKDYEGNTPLELAFNLGFKANLFDDSHLKIILSLIAMGTRIDPAWLNAFTHVSALRKQTLFNPINESVEGRAVILASATAAMRGKTFTITITKSGLNHQQDLEHYGAPPVQGYAPAPEKIGNVEIIKEPVIKNDLLIISDPSAINAQDKLFGMSGLMWAAARGNLPLAMELIKNNADPLLVDKAGDTALHYAVRNGHIPMAARLQQIAPLALIKKNKNGRTPVDVAIASKKSQKMLLALAR